MKIDLIQDYFGDDIFFRKPSVDINTGVTVLTGCNGYGKTSMLNSIRDYCEENNIKYIYFYSMENRQNDKEYAAMYGNISFLAGTMTGSEGEVIAMSIGKFAQKLGSFVHKNQNEKTLIVLMDAVDSGYSIDNIIELKERLFKIAIDDCKNQGIDLYIIVSANTYELTIGYPCLDPINCKYIDFKNYESYKDFILNTRNTKDQRK